MAGSDRAQSLDAVLDVVTDAAPTPLTASEIAEDVDGKRRTAYDKLMTLVERGDLETKKIGARGRVWWRPANTTDDVTDELTRLDHLNEIVRDIGRAVARSETRPALERAVAESVAASPAYRTAVVSRTAGDETFTLQAYAGNDEGLCEIAPEVEVGAAFTDPLAARAVRANGVIVERTGETPSVTDERTAHGMAVAVPLQYRDDVDGVLCVSVDDPATFDDRERTALTDLGDTVAHAFDSLERREVHDNAIELVFRSEELARLYAEAGEGDVHISFDSFVPLSDGTQLQYWTATEVSTKAFLDIVERLPTTLDVRLLSTVDETVRIEVLADTDSVFALFSSFGGGMTSATIDGDTFELVGKFPEETNTEAVTEALQDVYPSLELASSQQVLTPTILRDVVSEELTDRQQTALQLAYFSGYFEQPRQSTGEQLAERLDISKQTFHHHLRNAEAEVFRKLFDIDDISDWSDR